MLPSGPMMRCPSCELELPTTSYRCSCGQRFDLDPDRPDRRTLRRRNVLLIVLATALLLVLATQAVLLR